MSLGTWFRDYVYFPMGGNRVKPARHIFNLLVVWFITGMWHGASYNFILWGGYYGVLIILEKYIYGKYLEKSHVISRIYFFFVTVFGFIIFDTENLSQVFSKFGELFGVGTTALYDTSSLFYVSSYLFTLVIAFVCAMPIGKKLRAKLCEKEKSRAVFTCLGYAACFAMLIVSTAYLIDGSYNPFLYFRF